MLTAPLLYQTHIEGGLFAELAMGFVFGQLLSLENGLHLVAVDCYGVNNYGVKLSRIQQGGTWKFSEPFRSTIVENLGGPNGEIYGYCSPCDSSLSMMCDDCGGTLCPGCVEESGVCYHCYPECY